MAECGLKKPSADASGLKLPLGSVFLGTLPLLAVGRMETRIDSVDGKLGTVSERLVKVETQPEGGHVVLSR